MEARLQDCRFIVPLLQDRLCPMLVCPLLRIAHHKQVAKYNVGSARAVRGSLSPLQAVTSDGGDILTADLKTGYPIGDHHTNNF